MSTGSAGAVSVLLGLCSEVQQRLVSPEQVNMWSKFVPMGESIIATALVNKPNPFGFKRMRQIILTSGSKLIYVEPYSQQTKGIIDVNPNKCMCVKESNTTFSVRIVKGSRVYTFIDKLNGSQAWVDLLNALES